MTQLNACGLLSNPYNCFIDHLAPLCSFLEIPIITPYPENAFKFSRYYPDVKILIRDCSVEHILKNYTHVLYSNSPTPTFRELIEDQREKEPHNEIWQKSLKLIYHLHGCSDKGYHSTWIDPNSHIKDLDLLLITGNRLVNLLKDKNLYHVPKEVLTVGNCRYQYYLKHQKHLDQIVEKEIFSYFEKTQKTILYAPTWDDGESSSSFLEIYETLFEKLPKTTNLIVKLHPNMTFRTLSYDPSPVVKIIEKYEGAPNILFLPLYPLVYPLIAKCDIYLGDHSSVSYDVLTFKKPMFFLNINERALGDKGAYIFKCGRVIEKKEFSNLYHILEEDDSHYAHPKQDLYEEAFGEKSSHLALLSNLKEAFFKPRDTEDSCSATH